MSDDIIEKSRPAPLDVLIGYYEWEGFPCRIRRDDDNPHLLKADRYIPGKGFVDANVGEVCFKGYSLPEYEYRELMIRLSLRNRKAN